MPNSTATVAADSSRLLSSSADSRLIGANRPPGGRLGARKAKRAKPEPAATPRISSSRAPRAGSTAKVCTERRTPERTRKAPSIEKVKASKARNTVQAAMALRFSVTTAECSKAVAASQGMKLAFSTGSHAHQPPQPST